MPREIVMRHRMPHFLHIFRATATRPAITAICGRRCWTPTPSTAFEEAGDIFEPATAEQLNKFVYSAGDRRDPLDAYVAFRGRAPKIDGLMKKRGFA